MTSPSISGDGPVQVGGTTSTAVDATRTVNLSDAIFAIAMTLLVLGLEVPEVEAAGLPRELASMAPNLLAFLLAFGLIAQVWWLHHKLFSRLAHLDRGLIALNLALLCAVALMPFPAGLLGAHPTTRAGVLPFVGVFVVLLALFLALNLRAQAAGAWCHPMPAELAPWVAGGWVLALLMAMVAFGVALLSPVAGLVVLALSGAPEILLARLAPSGYAEWS
jgi:uncharacterized membrane protein